MTNNPQELVDAIEAGKMTDAGGMTTTQDVTDVVPYSYNTVAEKLHALEHDGVVESGTFGSDRVWTVAHDGDGSPDETTTALSIHTSTRGPVAT